MMGGALLLETRAWVLRDARGRVRWHIDVLNVWRDQKQILLPFA
jgi:hypothetical protein